MDELTKQVHEIEMRQVRAIGMFRGTVIGLTILFGAVQGWGLLQIQQINANQKNIEALVTRVALLEAGCHAEPADKRR